MSKLPVTGIPGNHQKRGE